MVVPMPPSQVSTSAPTAIGQEGRGTRNSPTSAVTWIRMIQNSVFDSPGAGRHQERAEGWTLKNCSLSEGTLVLRTTPGRWFRRMTRARRRVPVPKLFLFREAPLRLARGGHAVNVTLGMPGKSAA